MFGPVPKDPLERFMRYVSPEPNTGCWLWTGYNNAHGYGTFYCSRKKALAHRFAYEWFVGSIPKGLDLDHLCRIRCCVNPKHLEPVTRLENLLRGEPANRTHCPHGHAYDKANTRIYRNKRICRSCRRIRDRNDYLKWKER